MHPSLASIPTAAWYAQSPLTPRFTISPRSGSGSRLYTIYCLAASAAVSTRTHWTLPLTLRPPCRSPLLDDTSSASAGLFTPWVRSCPTPFPALDGSTELATHFRHIFCSMACAAARCSDANSSWRWLLLPSMVRLHFFRAGADFLPQKRTLHPRSPLRVPPHRLLRPQTAPTTWTTDSRGLTASRKRPRPCPQRTPRPPRPWPTT